MTPTRLAALCFVIGGAVLFISEVLALQLAGIVLLLAAIVAGAFAIASPEFLAGDED